MNNSFLVCSEKKLESLIIKKFHLNIWEINKKYIRMECGLYFAISKKDFESYEDLKFYLFTPFPVYKNNLSVIYQELLNDSNLNLIFNEKCTEIKECTKEDSFSYANLIKFGDGTKFLLIKPYIHKCEDTKIIFKINKNHINLDNFGDVFEFYVRFYFKVNLKKCKKNIISKLNLSTDFIIYDIRLRDVRLFDPNDLEDIYDKIIEVDVFYVFIINEVRYKPRITDSENLKYIRILEKNLFKNYVKELNRTIKKYTIYYWQFKLNSEKRHANLVASFEKEKGIRVLSSFALVMNIIVALIFCFADRTFNIEDFNPLILVIIAGLFIMMLSLPYLLRKLYNKFWISKANKKN